jgi:catechol 2,3-dioxygenase-like lactoylglutathione lyase family enzyme
LSGRAVGSAERSTRLQQAGILILERDMNLNHLDLPVTDVAAARSFFERHFGFRCVAAREELAVLLDGAGFTLTLSRLPSDESPRFPTGFHIGFNLATEADLLAAHERLSRAGVEIVRPLARFGPALTFQCSGPGAIAVELSWRAPP